MRSEALVVDGAHVLRPEPHRDDRGGFTRMWDAEVLRALGLDTNVSQISRSSNPLAGTLRGLHWQAPPNVETKVVTCVRGRAWDVVADVRPDSPTFGRWASVEIGGDDGVALYLPAGVAHGFLTLEDDTELVYVISEPYDPDVVRGVRWDDPTLAIAWPSPPTTISDRDRALPLLGAQPSR